jgi:hypothetical protein
MVLADVSGITTAFAQSRLVSSLSLSLSLSLPPPGTFSDFNFMTQLKQYNSASLAQRRFDAADGK